MRVKKEKPLGGRRSLGGKLGGGSHPVAPAAISIFREPGESSDSRTAPNASWFTFMR